MTPDQINHSIEATVQGSVVKTGDDTSSSADFIRIGTSWGDARSINLDDVYADSNYVVTGVRFVVSKEIWPPHHGASVGIEILMTRYFFETGHLVIHENQWINSYDSFNPLDTKIGLNLPKFGRSEFILDHPDNPLGYKLNLPDSKHGQYIQFRPSDLKKDAGQSTVPFFDSTPVTGKSSAALGGIGIFHKGTPGSGGFLSFKIMGIDQTNYINTTDVEAHVESGVHLSLKTFYHDDISSPVYTFEKK